MREPLKIDEIIAIALVILGIVITPMLTAGVILPANHPSDYVMGLGVMALVYLFICIAARKFDDVQRKYHTPLNQSGSNVDKK